MSLLKFIIFISTQKLSLKILLKKELNAKCWALYWTLDSLPWCLSELGQVNFLMVSSKDTSSCPTGFQLGYTTGQSCVG